MSPPIREGSGDNIGSIRLGDGTEIAEVRTGAGDVLFSETSIPGSKDLQARYDFSASNGSTPVQDQTANGFDLTGTFSGVTRSINGVQAGDFDSDQLNVSFSTVSQPTTIAIVAQHDTVGSSSAVFDADTGLNHLIRAEDDGPFFNMFAGNDLDGSTADTNPHIFVALFNGSNSILRVDGTQVASGDAGTRALDGVTLGSRGNGGNPFDGKMGECLVYPQDKSGIFGDIESYLSGKWGITV